MAEQRMSAKLTTLARKRGRLPALITAALIAAALLVQLVLQSLIDPVVANVAQLGTVLTDDGGLVPWSPERLVEPLLLGVLPFAIGVFLSLWMIAPIAAELGTRFVITRGLLATAAGAVVMLIVTLFVDLLRQVAAGFDARSFGIEAALDIQGALNVIIFRSPIVLLAAVLLWLWLREHPREYEVSGLIDEL
jgi:hypothetical protein